MGAGEVGTPCVEKNMSGRVEHRKVRKISPVKVLQAFGL